MTTIGIIGGIAPESTVQYYRLLLARYRLRSGTGGAPRIIINSIDLETLLGLVARADYAALTEYLSAEVARLAGAGATVGLFASNTPHVVFEAVRQRTELPLLSIVEAACVAAERLGLTRVGLIGTRFTMRGTFYSEVFSRRGITVVAPSQDEQSYIHARYVEQLVNGVFLAETRAGMLAIIHAFREREGLHGLILGGTELPLLLPETTDFGMVALDTTSLHVDCALEYILAAA